MSKYYYATFMQKQAFKNQYVKIMAANEQDARQCMFDHFGKEWMTTYTGEGFKGQIEKYNLRELMFLHVTNHGTKEHPSLSYLILEGERTIEVQVLGRGSGEGVKKLTPGEAGGDEGSC